MRIASVGHAVFAATLIVIGILGLIKGDFAPIWDPVPKGVPAREALAYLSGVISLAAGTGLLWERSAAAAARLLLASLLIWFLFFRLPIILHAPTVPVSWEQCGETAVIIAGGWVLYGWFAADWDRQRVGFAAGEQGVGIARVIYGLALIPLGIAHLAYVKETASLVPGWLPWHVGWTYFTGCAYIAAGLAVLTGVWGRLAATLSALQMGLFTLLVWVPIVAAGSKVAFQWSETLDSLALTAAGWVVADSYRGLRWLGVGRREALAATGQPVRLR